MIGTKQRGGNESSQHCDHKFWQKVILAFNSNTRLLQRVRLLRVIWSQGHNAMCIQFALTETEGEEVYLFYFGEGGRYDTQLMSPNKDSDCYRTIKKRHWIYARSKKTDACSAILTSRLSVVISLSGHLPPTRSPLESRDLTDKRLRAVYWMFSPGNIPIIRYWTWPNQLDFPSFILCD